MNHTIIKTTSFSEEAADWIVKQIGDILTLQDRFILGLCGGKTPEDVYREIAKQGQALPWQRIIITFGDERCVGPEHFDSNYRMAKATLFDEIAIPKENVLRIQGELPPEAAAKDYETKLLRLGKIKNGGFAHDLLLLGIGDDGHTASLFPETLALSETNRSIVANYIPKFSNYRITATFKLINEAEHVCFLVNDQKKTEIVKSVLRGEKQYPATFVTAKSSLTWILGPDMAL